MANFAIAGAAGYIAPRHLEAIKELGHNLVAAYDPSDSVGILDRYFPNCAFFTDFKQLDAYVKTQKIDYVSICSPNHMHFEQVAWAMGIGANAICEKPLVLTTKQLDELKACEKKTGRRVFTVLQLRVHSAIQELRDQIAKSTRKHHVELTYITSRGPWYMVSWKGDEAKSGGLATNIGVHFFDMLTWIFGDAKEIKVTGRTATEIKGHMILERAEVNWRLSIDRTQLPESAVKSGKPTYRSINIDGTEFEFSEGFTELHKAVYRDIIAGRGYGIEDVRPSIAIVERLRSSQIEPMPRRP